MYTRHNPTSPPPPPSNNPPIKFPRDVLMIGRRIKTTGITVLRAEPSKGEDWWVCRCPCGREFVAHGWGVRHGRTRNCGSDEHNEQPRGHQVLVSAI